MHHCGEAFLRRVLIEYASRLDNCLFARTRRRPIAYIYRNSRFYRRQNDRVEGAYRDNKLLSLLLLIWWKGRKTNHFSPFTKILIIISISLLYPENRCNEGKGEKYWSSKIQANSSMQSSQAALSLANPIRNVIRDYNDRTLRGVRVKSASPIRATQYSGIMSTSDYLASLDRGIHECEIFSVGV